MTQQLEIRTQNEKVTAALDFFLFTLIFLAALLYSNAIKAGNASSLNNTSSVAVNEVISNTTRPSIVSVPAAEIASGELVQIEHSFTAGEHIYINMICDRLKVKGSNQRILLYIIDENGKTIEGATYWLAGNDRLIPLTGWLKMPEGKNYKLAAQFLSDDDGDEIKIGRFVLNVKI